MDTSISYKVLTDGRVAILMNDRQLLTFMQGVDGEPCLMNGEVDFNCRVYQVEQNWIQVNSSFVSQQDISWIYPIFDAKIEEPEAIFRQGFGLGGPSGFISMDELKEKSIIYSHGLILLKYKEGYISIYADNHIRYDNKYDVRTDCRNELCYRMSAGFALENTVRNGDLPNINICFHDRLEYALEHAAKAIAAPYSPPVPQKPAYNWCSWYYYYNNLDFNQLRDFLEGLKDIDPHVPIKYVQIDAGYFTAAGDWLDANNLWPGGLKAAFDLIKAYGFIPGIWIGPFMVGNRSKLFKEHPDWMIKYTDGSYVKMWQWYMEPKVWGYQDEEYFVLDTSIPQAIDYLRNVFKTLKEWGAEFFKTDFMLWGIQPSHKVIRHVPGLTSVEHYRNVMTMIREEIKDSYWLGCIAPFLPSLGFVNGMRIAGDVGAKWDGEGFGPEGMIQELVADNYFNGIYWQNDPDAVMLRDFHVFLKEHEIKSLALLQAMSGGMIYTSDPLGQIDKSRLDLFRFIEPDVIRRPRIPFIAERQDVLLLHHKLDNTRHVILIFNPTSKEQVIFYKLSEVAGVEALYTRDWANNKTSKNMETYIGGKVAGHDCILIFGDEERHITCEINNIWKW